MTVIKIPKQIIDNRSAMQRRILAYLATTGHIVGERIGHLPRTGDVIDHLLMRRDKLGFASVSRSLARLRAAGLIVAYCPNLCTRGNGVHWALANNEYLMTRARLPNRRRSLSFNFSHAGFVYHATATRYPNGDLAEIFLDTGRAGSSVQQHAEATAILASIALQHGVAPEALIHALAGGPLVAALELAVVA